MERDSPFDEVLKLVQRLTPEEKRRLIERVEREARSAESSKEPGAPGENRSLLGLVKDLGPAPSEEEIDEARIEAWFGFPREDI